MSNKIFLNPSKLPPCEIIYFTPEAIAHIKTSAIYIYKEIELNNSNHCQLLLAACFNEQEQKAAKTSLWSNCIYSTQSCDHIGASSPISLPPYNLDEKIKYSSDNTRMHLDRKKKLVNLTILQLTRQNIENNTWLQKNWKNSCFCPFNLSPIIVYSYHHA